MDNPLVFKLLEEILLQCRQARHAFSAISAKVTANEPEAALFYVDGFLSRAANVSRLLWPDASNSAQRGQKLRAELGMEDDLDLKLGEYRRLAADYDERLVEWASSAEHRDFVGVNLMPSGTLQGFKEDQFHRSLDPDTLKFSFEGTRLNLHQLQKDLQRVERLAENWQKLNNPW